MSQPPLFALVDCNNFFVSCERLFRPELTGKPVVVLSSNDGCAIARSNEAKALGIPMAAPVFKYRQLLKDHGVTQFSANFELYGDISDRIIRLLSDITPRIEVYSVDESFLDLSQLPISDHRQWAEQVRARIWREIGIPVSIGIAPTKTLAKLASEQGKQRRELAGVLDIAHLGDLERQAYLQDTPVEKVWGIGRKLAPKLKAERVFTAHDIAQMNPRRARQLMGIHGRQLVHELNGISCLPLERAGKIRQTVMHGRIFGEDTNNEAVLQAAVAGLAARACLRLRRSGLVCRGASLSLSTNRLKPGYQRLSQYHTLATPSSDTGIIITQLIAALGKMHSLHASYHRANILLYDLQPEGALQADLFGNVDISASKASLNRMHAFDAINTRYGGRTIRYAAEDLSQSWQPKHQLRSPRYTTHWSELPTAHIKAQA